MENKTINYDKYRNELSNWIKALKEDNQKEKAKELLEKAKNTELYSEAKKNKTTIDYILKGSQEKKDSATNIDIKLSVDEILEKIGSKYQKVGGITTDLLKISFKSVIESIEKNDKTKYCHWNSVKSATKNVGLLTLGEYLGLTEKEAGGHIPRLGDKHIPILNQYITDNYGVNPNEISAIQKLEIKRYKKENKSKLFNNSYFSKRV